MADEGTTPDGQSTTPTAEQLAATAAAKVISDAAAEKAKQDAALLDENGNPKADASGDTPGSGDAGVDDKSDDVSKLEGKVTTRAKQVEDLIKAADVDPSKMIAAADPETGELAVEDKAKLITKHGEAIADLIEGNISKMMGDIKAIGAAKDNAVYSQLEKEFKGITEQSGKETWKELSTWVKDNVDTDTRKAYNDMLNKGGVSASLAVKAMISSFKERENVTVDAQLLDADEGVAATGGFVTRAEYNEQLDKLIAKGHDYNTSPEVAALNKKRMKSMQAGK